MFGTQLFAVRYDELAIQQNDPRNLNLKGSWEQNVKNWFVYKRWKYLEGNLAKGGDGGRQPEEVLAKMRITKKRQAEANPNHYKDLAETGRLKMKELRSSSTGWEQARIEAIKDGIIPGQRSDTQKKVMADPTLRENLSNLNKGKPRIGFGRRRPVRSSEGLEFNSVKEAAAHYKVTDQTVSSALNNSDAIFAFDTFIYFSYLNQEHEQEKNKKRRISSSEGLTFSTITEAAKHYQADWVTIQHAIKQQKNYKGILFTLEFI